MNNRKLKKISVRKLDRVPARTCLLFRKKLPCRVTCGATFYYVQMTEIMIR